MAPFRMYTKWNSRPSNAEERIDPFRRYYIICEGKNTEKWYFEKLIESRKELSINSPIEIIYLEKTGEHESWSNPKSLFELADKAVKEYEFDKAFDKVVIVFDVDIYEHQESFEKYKELINNATNYQIVAITNPSFELFLLLHFPNSLNDIILPNSDSILKNKKIDCKGEQIRFVECLLRRRTSLRPKKDIEIGELAFNVRLAIDQETRINNNIFDCKGKLTSNVGMVINSMLETAARAKD